MTTTTTTFNLSDLSERCQHEYTFLCERRSSGDGVNTTLYNESILLFSMKALHSRKRCASAGGGGRNLGDDTA